jgi:type II secretory pathway pseudopilin PulG
VKKTPFTLLEMMLVFALLAIGASAIGWSLHQKIGAKRFSSTVEKLHSRLQFCRQLALNSQSDWGVDWIRTGKKWKIVTYCIDDPKQTGPLPLSLEELKVSLNGEEKAQLSFEFTASGDISPKGTLVLEGSDKLVWQIPDLFLVQHSSLVSK